MTTRTPIKNRLLCALLAISIVIAYIPVMTVAADVSGSNSDYSIVADPSTMNDWQKYFGSNVKDTSYAGAVWTDKSVFTAATNPFAGVSVSDANRNFLVALSALASNKSIVGYSNIPTDTMLVLDISNSMINNGAVDELVTATNAAITQLLALNNNNRVGVVLYSSEDYSSHDQTGNSSTILLPLGRYTATETENYDGGTPNDTSDDRTVNVYLDYSYVSGNKNTKAPPPPDKDDDDDDDDDNNQSNGHYITVNTGVKNSSNTTVNPSGTSNKVEGGTYIQSGLDTAMDMLLAADTEISDGFQAGTERMPVVVLMSDGAPTYASTNISNIGNSSVGNGSDTSNINTFLTQLTAAYAKAKIDAHYQGSTPLFYTLGLGVGSNTHATNVLNPTTSVSTINSWWNTYVTSSAITSGNNRGTVAIRHNDRNYYVTKVSELTSASQKLYVDKYFNADTAADLYAAFDAIVQQIIIQSLYYPTLAADGEHNFGGYLTFIDDIGEYMDVVSIKGIQLGSTLFTGAELSKNFASGSNGGDLGTSTDPTALGNEFIWAVIDRFGFDDDDSPYKTYEEQVAAARSLVNLAYTHGQLSYTSPTEFSNYIGSYQDANGNFISFYNEGTTTTPDNAKYKIKSYGMLGAVQDGMKETDMMYVSIQVRTEIATGKTAVIWQIPASLIPVVSYNVTIEGVTSTEQVTANTPISVEIDDADPIRLLFEVGLRSDINDLNVEQIMDTEGLAADSVAKNSDGTYSFLTNRYDQEAFDNHISHPNEDKPNDAVNTVSYFEPSKENERYYYTSDSTIYVNTSGTAYKGSSKPTSGTYYRLYHIFKYDNATKKYVYEDVYEEISAISLSKAATNDAAPTANSTWYIPAETIHRITATDPVNKTGNTTETLTYSNYPTVESGNNHYYVDAILGNNGKLTLTPATGLVLTKTVDSTLAGTNEEFTFNIVASTALADGSYDAVHTDTDGNAITNGIDSVTFAGGSASVKLKADESLIILVPAGSYTITEVIVTGKHYTVSKITVGSNVSTNAVSATAVVTDRNLTNVAFENTYRVNNGHGNLVISKSVTGVDPANAQLAGKTFTFDVTLTNSESDVTGQTYNTSTGTVTTDASGKFTVTLKAGESVSVHDLPAKTQVTVTETNIPAGFTVVDSATRQTTITADTTSTIAYVNNYDAASVTADITISGDKTLTGRDWLSTDSFEFSLEIFDNTVNDWVAVPGAAATVTMNSKSYQITFNKTYDTTGTYYYRIVETNGGKTINGVTFDDAVGYFTVSVTDDLSGQLMVDVTPSTDNSTTVTDGANANEFDVKLDFTNSYVPQGTATVTIDVNKIISGNSQSSISLSGFEFGLFDSTGTNRINTAVTDAEGKASFSLTYGPNYAGQTLTYILREIVPSTPIDGMTYDTTPRTITVVIEDNESTGQIYADIYMGTTDPDANATATSVTAQITNNYNANAATVDFGGLKVLNGRSLNAGEFAFRLYEADANFKIGAQLQEVYNTIIQTRNTSNYNFIFKPLVYSETGSYYYVVEEVNTRLGGVSYDSTKYYITVEIGNDGDFDNQGRNGHLDSRVTIEKVQGATRKTIVDANTSDTGFLLADTDGISFTNTYRASGKVEPDATVTINKVIKDLSGSNYNFSEAGYVFGLFDADGNPVLGSNNKQLTATTGANGSVTFTMPEIYVYDDPNAGGYQIGDIITYHLKELANSVPGMQKNDQVYIITVEIVDDWDGTVSAKVTIHEEDHYTTVGSATFTNTYDPQDVTVAISGEKTMVGRDMTAGEFKFHLYQVADNTFTIPSNATPLLTAKNAAAAKNAASRFSFTAANGELTFSKVGTYYFVVIEEHSGRTVHGVTHSDAVYNIAVKVTNNAASGSLAYSLTINGTAVANNATANTIQFTNTYANTPAHNNVTIQGKKALNGRPWNDTDAFNFKVERFTASTWNDSTKASASNWLQVGAMVTVNKDNRNLFDLTGCLPTEFPAEGTYRYRIVEVNGGKSINGVAYSNAKAYITITVVSNNQGSLVIDSVTAEGATVTGNSTNGWTVSATFTNTYSATGTATNSITVNKVIEDLSVTGKKNDKLSLDGYEFGLYDGDKLVGSTAKTVNGTAILNLPTYTKDHVGQTYTYTLRELESGKPGIITSTETYKVTVAVVDNGDGTISANVTSDQTFTFTNTYDPAPANASGKISGSKFLIGRDWKSGEKYTFELYEANKDFVITSAIPLLTAQNGTPGNDGKASFTFVQTEKNELTFDKVGTYYFVIKEANAGQTIDGVTYSTSKYQVAVEVTNDEENGKLVAKVVYTDPVVFENTYATVPVENNITVTGNKILTGRDWLSTDSFEFQLEQKIGSTWTKIGTTDSVNMSDTQFELTANLPGSFTEGTYTYRIVEVNGGSTNKGVTYDATVTEFTVTVTDKLDGTLKIEVQSPSASVVTGDSANGWNVNASFENKYDTTGSANDVSIDINKTIDTASGVELPLSGFVFGLFDADGNKVMDANGKHITVLTNDEGKATIVLPAISREAGHKPGDVLTYTVKEIVPEDSIQNMGYDTTTVHTVKVKVIDDLDGTISAIIYIDNEANTTNVSVDHVNTYTPDKAEVIIKGTKILNGRDLNEGEFSFQLFDADGKPIGQPVKNAANNGSFSFPSLSFDKLGEYVYTVTEIDGKLGGVTYDGTSHKVTIKVTADVENGKLVAEVIYEDGDQVVITNTYTAEGTEATISGEKKLSGRDLLENEFTFHLLDSDGSIVESVKNKADGTFSFKALEFDKVDVYTYYVVESDAEKLDRVTYDATKYKVTITVTDNGDGTLTAVTEVTNLTDVESSSEKIVFNNVYTPKPADINVVLGVKKIVKNVGAETIGPDGFQFVLVDAETGKSIATVITDKDGLASIDLPFTENDIGKHIYKLSELDTGVEGVTYSKSVYDIEITVSLSEDNKLVASVVSNNAAVDSLVAEFVNTYAVDVPPKTTDNFNMSLWLCLLFISGGVIATMVLPTAKKKSES